MKTRGDDADNIDDLPNQIFYAYGNRLKSRFSSEKVPKPNPNKLKCLLSVNYPPDFDSKYDLGNIGLWVTEVRRNISNFKHHVVLNVTASDSTNPIKGSIVLSTDLAPLVPMLEKMLTLDKRVLIRLKDYARTNIERATKKGWMKIVLVNVTKMDVYNLDRYIRYNPIKQVTNVDLGKEPLPSIYPWYPNRRRTHIF